MDLGVKDFTATIFGYYDFKNAKLIIEDEHTINGSDMTTDLLAIDIKSKESELNYTNIKLRIADNNNLLMLNDFAINHNLPFFPTTKSDLASMVNKVKILISQGKLIVNPRCKMLLGCLKHAKWAKNRRGEMFARSSTYQHYDHAAALVYMVRSMDSIMMNPIPINHNFTNNTFIHPNLKNMHAPENIRKLDNIFKQKPINTKNRRY